MFTYDRATRHVTKLGNVHVVCAIVHFVHFTDKPHEEGSFCQSDVLS